MSKTKRIDPHIFSLAPEIEALAETAAFASTESLAVAGRRMMAKHIRKLYQHLPGVVTGDDPHDVHQARVATRRLRASLTATEVAYRSEQVARLRKRLRNLARMLGDVRDRDVLLIRLRADDEAQRAEEHAKLQSVIERLESEEQHSELAETIALVQAERNAAHVGLVRELGRKRTLRLLQELTDFVTCPLEQIQAADAGLPLLVRHHAGGAIWREFEAVQRFESVMPQASSERLHAVRIACKHLRYTLELFEPALPEEAQSVIKQVTAMQEQLGNLHDTDVALEYLHHQAAGSTPAASTNGVTDSRGTELETGQQHISKVYAYINTRSTEREQLLAGVEPLWRMLTSEALRRKLGKLIAAL